MKELKALEMLKEIRNVETQYDHWIEHRFDEAIKELEELKQIKPKYKHKDIVYYLRDGKVSEESIIGTVYFNGDYNKDKNQLEINYYYELSGWISGTKFNEESLFETREKAEEQLLKESRC